MTTLTEVFPCFFLSCKANSRVKPAKTGHGPALFPVFVLFYIFFCVVLPIFVLFYVVLCCSMYCLFCDVLCIICVYMCTEQLPQAVYSTAVKYIISYQCGNLAGSFEEGEELSGWERSSLAESPLAARQELICKTSPFDFAFQIIAANLFKFCV